MYLKINVIEFTLYRYIMVKINDFMIFTVHCKENKRSWEDFQSLTTCLCLLHTAAHEQYETDNRVLFLYAEMEAHSSGLGRKRKREELNGDTKEAECFRKRPRRTLVSIGKVAVSQHLMWWYHFLCMWWTDLMCVFRAWLNLRRSPMSWWLQKPHTFVFAWKKPAVALQVCKGWFYLHFPSLHAHSLHDLYVFSS